MNVISRSELADALRTAPENTLIDVVFPGDSSVGIFEAHYSVGGYAGGIIYLTTVMEPLTTGRLLSAIEENSGGPTEVMLWDIEVGDYADCATEITRAYYVPEQTYCEDYESECLTDSAYFQIVAVD